MNTKPCFLTAALLLLLTAGSASAQVFDAGPSDPALFDTVINLPPAPNIGSGQSIGGDGQTTQVNLASGGFINSSFDVLAGGELNVTGGRINTSLDVRDGGEFNLSGGLIGFTGQAFSGSRVTITGGLIDQNFESLAGSTVLLKGGAVSRRFRARAGSGVEIFGQDFLLNGNAIAAPDLAEVSLSGDDVLTGVLEDGSAFIFSPQAGDVLLDVQFNASTLPGPADLTPIVIDTANPVRPSGVRAGQTFTLRDGGELPINFEAVDATVNIEGGFLDDHSGFSRSVVNITGGEVAAFSNAYAGTTLNLTGGLWGTFSDAHSGSVINVNGGTLASFFEAQAGSTLNLNLGVVERFTALPGSNVNLRGGAIGQNFDLNAGTNAELFGGEFRLNGQAFAGDTLTLGDDDLFTATLADGSTVIFAGSRSDDINGLKLTQAALPALNTTPQFVNTPNPNRPSGLRAGQTLTLQDGGELGPFFQAINATLHVEGGQLGPDAEFLESTLNVTGGHVERALTLIDSTLNFTGGTLGNQSQAMSGSVVNVSGGFLGSEFLVDNSILNLTGGVFDEELTLTAGSTANIRGGDLGVDFEFETGSLTNVFATEFFVDGEAVEFLSPGTSLSLLGNDLVLSGTFEDGDAFSFDFIDSDTTLSLTLISALLGDYNSNSVVDAADYTIWQDNFNSTTNLAADGNGNGVIDAADYTIWQDNFGTANLQTNTLLVPEPTTLALLLFTGLASGSRSRRVR